MTAFLRRPKSHFDKAGELKPTAPKHNVITKKPDVQGVKKTHPADNILKFALDALQPLVLHDDQVVQKASTEKIWCKTTAEEKVIIELTVF